MHVQNTKNVIFTGENGEPGRVINAGKALSCLYYNLDLHFYTFKTDSILYLISICSRLQLRGNSWTTRDTWPTWTCWTSRTVRWATEYTFFLLNYTI